MKKKKQNLKSKITSAAVFVVIAAIIATCIILYRNSQKTVFNDSLSANGSTPGNLYNSGLFAEADGNVYFSNPLDNNTLYVMNSDETVATKISSETVFSLNVYGNYIYYSKNDLNDSNSTSILRGSLLGAARCNLDGTHVVELNDRYTGQIALIGNTILFQDFESDRDAKSTTFDIKSIGIDGRDVQTFSERTIDIAGTVGTTIYYAETKDNHNLYSMSSRTKSSSLLLEGNCWRPIVFDRELYYIDLDDNYSLVKTSLTNTKDRTVLVNERISTYNVSDTYIYFQIDDGDNSKLCRIRKDASTNEYEVVMEGNYENINLTSKYAYFNLFDNRGLTYRTSLNGMVQVKELSNVLKLENPKDK